MPKEDYVLHLSCTSVDCCMCQKWKENGCGEKKGRKGKSKDIHCLLIAISYVEVDL